MRDNIDDSESGTESRLAAVGRRQECRGPTGRSRTSKIARLPAAVREEINERLLDGEAPGEIVSWANSQPAVKKVLERHFASQPITEVNLTRWRHGGYAGWLEHRTTQEAVNALAAACAGVDDPFMPPSLHLGVIFISTSFLIVEMSLGALTEKRIPRPSAYGLASENIFLIAAGSTLVMARP